MGLSVCTWSVCVNMHLSEIQKLHLRNGGKEPTYTVTRNSHLMFIFMKRNCMARHTLSKGLKENIVFF